MWDPEAPGASPVTNRRASPIKRDALVQDILQAAHTHYANNNVAAACDFLSLLDHCTGHTPETLQTLGNLRFVLGNYGSAAAAYQMALTHAPAHAGLWVALALTSRQLKDLETMQCALKSALDLEPGNPEGLKLLADELRDQCHYQEAAHIYGDLVQRGPRHLDNCLSLAKCFFELGDIPTAVSALRQVLALDPAHQSARENLVKLEALVAANSDRATSPGSPLITV